MARARSITTVLRTSTLLMVLAGLDSVLLCAQAGPGSPQEGLRIPDLSTPGREHTIDVGGRKLQCLVHGHGSPPVVLVSGLEAPQAYWNPVIPGLAARTTVVTCDRAGVGKSEIGALPTHGEQSARDLHVLLGKLGVAGPCVLVGHSYGAGVARLFASMFPADTGGLILEEPQHENVLDELRKVLKGKDLEAFDELMAARFTTPEHPRTEADYRETTREQLRKSGPLPGVPLVIVTVPDRAKAMPPIFSDDAFEAMAAVDRALLARLAALIPGGRQVFVDKVGHDIHVEKPAALIARVLEVVEAAGGKDRGGPTR